MTLAADQVTELKIAYCGPELHDLPHEFVAHHQRDPDVSRGPGVPPVDVEVGAADARAQDSNEDVVVADRRFGHVLKGQPGPRLCLHQGLHQMPFTQERVPVATPTYGVSF
jgi:hypothetical protein